MEGFEQENNEEVLKYLEPTENEIFRARSIIQLKLMARILNLEINDDPDPEKQKLIDDEWESGYSKEYANLLKEKPELLFKYIHGHEDDVVDELQRLLLKNHAPKTTKQKIKA
jgi:hypothetical protein